MLGSAFSVHSANAQSKNANNVNFNDTVNVLVCQFEILLIGVLMPTFRCKCISRKLVVPTFDITQILISLGNLLNNI